MSVDLLCVGHAAYDINMYLAEYPRENSKAEIHDMASSGGGPAANAAYLNSFWGVRSAFAGLVGDDSHGQAIRDEFLAVGTDVSLLERRGGHATPFSVILVNAQTGSRTIINRKAPGASYHLNAEIAAELHPKCLLFDGHELEASCEALERWPAAISILDAGSVRPGTVELAGRVTYLVASERFALQATGEPALTSEGAQRGVLKRLQERFPSCVVVTMGERGLITEVAGEFKWMPAFPVRAIDTTGAGDIFHGAFAHGCVTGLDFWPNLRRASMTAALSVQKHGGRKSIPSLTEVQEALTDAH
jgi:sulfofructose kinase